MAPLILPYSLMPTKKIIEIMFSCSCGWKGSQHDLDVITNDLTNLVCCPDCKSLDYSFDFKE
ncbi:MAG: hypothetical protein COB45_08430 [Gammaproteobacteria bacterium]|nr:MAG: hypothetical protein COB45_08430 [Gammaproteobacteria bacterium]